MNLMKYLLITLFLLNIPLYDNQKSELNKKFFAPRSVSSPYYLPVCIKIASFSGLFALFTYRTPHVTFLTDAIFDFF